MNKQSILKPNQKLFLKLLAVEKSLNEQFCLTGGTALTAFYIPYRLSEDLDFFSEREVETEPILVFLRSVKKQLGYQDFDLNTSFNRNLFILNFAKETLKLEFTYFPFPPIEKPKKIMGIYVENILDIAVNKLFTIYQQPRARDFMDLYMIQKKYRYSLDNLLKKARLKFDWHIDLLKLGSQFLLARELKDYPKLLKPLSEKLWQNYFLAQARNFGKKIIEK